MNCDDYQENASRFTDGKLDASGQVRLFAHLSNCSECRSFLASSVRVREVIRKDPASLPAGIDDELFERLSTNQVPGATGRDHPQPFWRRDVSLSFPLAAAALLVVALVSLLFSLIYLRTSPTGSTIQTVLDRSQAGTGRQTVVVVYQLPEEQVITVPPSKMVEVRARTVAN